MQVLLFLTALLSALTGVVAGPRSDDSRLAQAEERLVSAFEVIAPSIAVALRPTAPVQTLVRLIVPASQREVLPARLAPLATVKLIE